MTLELRGPRTVNGTLGSVNIVSGKKLNPRIAYGTLGFVFDIDSDSQVDNLVKDTACGALQTEGVVCWILFDEFGPRCIWERNSVAEFPKLVEHSSRYIGSWIEPFFGIGI